MAVIAEDMLTKFPLDKTNISEFTTKVVGLTFRDPKHVDAVETGDVMYIQAEIGNEHDATACMVIHNETGNHVGYLSKDFSKIVWNNIMTRGDLYIAKAEVTGGTEDKQKGINLLVKHLRLKDS
jgi:hypothetical protein